MNAICRRCFEEWLRIARDRFHFFADLFELLAVTPEGSRDRGLSSEACGALTDVCHQAGRDLDALLGRLPADLLNWTSRPTTRQG